jgi:hypothetical protein
MKETKQILFICFVMVATSILFVVNGRIQYNKGAKIGFHYACDTVMKMFNEQYKKDKVSFGRTSTKLVFESEDTLTYHLRYKKEYFEVGDTIK